MVLGDGAFGKWLNHEALMNGISVPIKETPKASLPFLPCDDTARRQQSMDQEAGSHQTQISQCLDIGLFISRTVRNKILLFLSHLVYGIVIEAWTDEDIIWEN